MANHGRESMSNRLTGGISQYAHPTSDIDDAILLLREREQSQFLKQLGDLNTYSLQDVAGLIHVAVLLYPDSIRKEEAKDYELRMKKEFVPEAFLQDMSLYDDAQDDLLAYILKTWTKALAANANELLKVTLTPDTADKMFADQTRRDAAKALLKYAEARHQIIQEQVVDATSNKPAIEFLIRELRKLQTEEILTIYFEQLLGLELLKHFYGNRKLDVYAKNYKQVTLPVQQDPFLRELNLFIDDAFSNRDAFRDLFSERFHNYDPVNPDPAEIPEHLQQKMIIQAFNQFTVVSESLLPYALAIGHQNQVLQYNTPVKQRFSIVSPKDPLAFEPVIDPGMYNQVGGIKKYLRECITGLMEGFPIRAD